MPFLVQQNRRVGGEDVAGRGADPGERQARRGHRRRRHRVRLHRHVVPPGRAVGDAARHPARSRRCRRTSWRCGRTGRPRCAPPPARPKAPSASSRPRRSASRARTARSRACAAPASTRSASRSRAPSSCCAADLVFLAIGFAGSQVEGMIAQSGVKLDRRNNVVANEAGLPDVAGQGVRGRRHAARAVARGVGDPRGTTGGTARSTLS